MSDEFCWGNAASIQSSVGASRSSSEAGDLLATAHPGRTGRSECGCIPQRQKYSVWPTRDMFRHLPAVPRSLVPPSQPGSPVPSSSPTRSPPQPLRGHESTRLDIQVRGALGRQSGWIGQRRRVDGQPEAAGHVRHQVLHRPARASAVLRPDGVVHVLTKLQERFPVLLNGFNGRIHAVLQSVDTYRMYESTYGMYAAQCRRKVRPATTSVTPREGGGGPLSPQRRIR